MGGQQGRKKLQAAAEASPKGLCFLLARYANHCISIWKHPHGNTPMHDDDGLMHMF